MSRRGNTEGTIHRRKDGRWAAALSLGYQGGRRRRKYLYGKIRGEVSRKLQEAQRTLSDGGILPGEKQTVQTLLETWLKDSAAQKVRSRTLQRYQEIVRLHLVPALGTTKLTKLNPVHVERMMNDALEHGASPRSVTHFRAVLRTALNAAMRWGWVNRNAAGLTDPPRVTVREVRALSVEDAQAVLTAVAGDRLETLYTLSLACGLRQGESLGLSWKDTDLQAGTVTVRRSLERVDGEWRLSEPKPRAAGAPYPCRYLLSGPCANTVRAS
jgi:integrase